MATKEIMEELALLDSEHNPMDVPEWGKVKDGTYQGRLDTARVEKSKTSGRLQSRFSWEVLAGEYEGRTITKFQGMEDKDNLDFLTRDIYTMKGEKFPFTWSQIEDVYKDILDFVHEIKVTTKGDFQNVMIQKRIYPDKDANVHPAEKTKSDDLPF